MLSLGIAGGVAMQAQPIAASSYAIAVAPSARRRFLRSFAPVAAACAVRVAAGLVFGLLASLLLLLSIEMLARASGRPPIAASLGSAVILITWGLATTALLYRASALSTVCARAGLLGAAQWLAVIPIALAFVSGTLPINTVEAQVVKHHLKLILGSSALTIAFLCLMGWACIVAGRRVWRRLSRSGARTSGTRDPRNRSIRCPLRPEWNR